MVNRLAKVKIDSGCYCIDGGGYCIPGAVCHISESRQGESESVIRIGINGKRRNQFRVISLLYGPMGLLMIAVVRKITANGWLTLTDKVNQLFDIFYLTKAKDSSVDLAMSTTTLRMPTP